MSTREKFHDGDTFTIYRDGDRYFIEWDSGGIASWPMEGEITAEEATAAQQGNEESIHKLLLDVEARGAARPAPRPVQ